MLHHFPEFVPGLYGTCTYCNSVYPGSAECLASTEHPSRQYAVNDVVVISSRITELYAERTVALNTPTIPDAPGNQDLYDGCG